MSIEASADAQLVQDFANTRDRRSFVPRGHPHRDGTTDELATSPALRDWLAEHNLLPDHTNDTDITDPDHNRVLRLRTALRDALDRNRHPGPDPQPHPFTMSLRVELDPDHGPRLSTPEHGVTTPSDNCAPPPCASPSPANGADCAPAPPTTANGSSTTNHDPAAAATARHTPAATASRPAPTGSARPTTTRLTPSLSDDPIDHLRAAN